MAKMKRNIGELVSGKIGNVVFVNIKDKSYVRSSPVRQPDSWTDLQLLYRNRLSKIAGLWRSIPHGPLRQIWSGVSTDINGYASFVKANMPALAIDGTLIDPTLLTLAAGKLENPQLMKADREEEPSQRIRVSWQNDQNSKPERGNDALMAVTFAQDHFSAPTDTGLQRGDQLGSFILPQVPPDGKCTLFLFMKSKDGQTSTSVSFALE